MRGSGVNIGQLCDECRAGVNISRYAGLPVHDAKELDREVSRQLDQADAGALHEPWHALLTERCPRCGGHLAQQSMDAEEQLSKPVAVPNGAHRLSQA